MELVLEQDEVEELLREALEGRGITLSPGLRMTVRRNNKKGTIRVVYKPAKSAGQIKRTGRQRDPRSGTGPALRKDQDRG